MIEKWLVSIGDPERVEVERESKASVWFKNGSQRRKRSDYENYFDTKEDAVSFLLGRTEARIASLRREIETRQQTLAAWERKLAAMRQRFSTP